MEAAEESTALVSEIRSLAKIDSAEQYKAVAEKRALIKTMIKFHEDRFEPRIKEARQHVENLRKDLAAFVDPLKQVYAHAGELLVLYDQEQARMRRERELEEERKRKEQEELARLANELGNKELAEEIKERVQAEPRPIIIKETPTAKETGVSFREDWKFEITDESAIPRAYLVPDQVKIGKVVRAMKQATNIPGVRAYSVKVPVQKT